jgi:hypothetical protein
MTPTKQTCFGALARIEFQRWTLRVISSPSLNEEKIDLILGLPCPAGGNRRWPWLGDLAEFLFCSFRHHRRGHGHRILKNGAADYVLKTGLWLIPAADQRYAKPGIAPRRRMRIRHARVGTQISPGF